MTDTSEVKYDNPKDVLIAARKLIEKPENWLNRCPSMEEDFAGKKCAARAIWTIGESGCPFSQEAYDLMLSVTGTGTLPEFNDKHSHAEVLAAFDRAIAAATGDREGLAAGAPST